MSTAAYDVLVLGAGPAGLGAAFRLAGSGRRVLVLERADAIGGLAGSFDVAGQRVDHGSHRLHPSTPPAIMAQLRTLLGDDLQRRPRHGRIRMAGRFVAFPPKATNLVRNLPPALSTHLARDMVTSPFRRPRADTFLGVVHASLGPTMAARFYAPYVEKLFGVPATELSGELARRRVGASSASQLVRRVVRPDPERSVFYYPRRGYGQISEAFATAAVGAGAEIETGTEVVALCARPEGVLVRTHDGRALTAASVWTTLPLGALTRLASAPEAVLAAAQRLETRALLLVYLAMPAGRWTQYDAHYFPESSVPMSRVSEPKNYRASDDDPRDLTVLCAEVPCSVGDERWLATPDALASEVREALARCDLPTPAPVETVVKRVPAAYPVYRVGYEEAFGAVDAWASALPRILHFGRQGLFAHDNTHHALAMAWAAADALNDDGLIDAERWVQARASFAAHVVED